MEIPIIKIGNSKGIRLPKTILKKYGFNDKVDLVMEEDGLVLKPIKKARAGWEESFKQIARKGNNELIVDDLLMDNLLIEDLLIDDIFEDETFEEWE